MADMVLAGFPIRQNPADVFPPLRPDQVAIGLPAGPQAGNGHTRSRRCSRRSPA